MTRFDFRTGCSALRHHGSGASRPWQVTPRPMDPSVRLRAFGKVLPMEPERGLIARLLGMGRGL
jgi:hypothetical protein